MAFSTLSEDRRFLMGVVGGIGMGVGSALGLNSLFPNEVNINLSEDNTKRMDFGYCEDAAEDLTETLEEELNEQGFTLGDAELACLEQPEQ